MRLINIHTLELEEFVGDKIPPYCILSHRWTDDEITFKDFRKGRRKDSAGYEKIVKFCELVRDVMPRHAFFRIHEAREVFMGYEDSPPERMERRLPEEERRLHAELQEAINSMYAWYKDAFCCFVHLADVSEQTFNGSVWFSRGWTLQELLAPDKVIFCDAEWRPFGWVGPNWDHDDLFALLNITSTVSSLTGISKEHICAAPDFRGNHHQRYANASIAEKMSWAAHRMTTRVEDQAYCMLGIFGVNIPLLYGEGRNAFQRLQQEIIRTSADQSVFAWSDIRSDYYDLRQTHVFATSPEQFRSSGNVRPLPSPPYELTNCGLRLTAPHVRVSGRDNDLYALLRLNCYNMPPSSRISSKGKLVLDTPFVRYIDDNQPYMIVLVLQAPHRIGPLQWRRIGILGLNADSEDQRASWRLQRRAEAGEYQKEAAFIINAFEAQSPRTWGHWIEELTFEDSDNEESSHTYFEEARPKIRLHHRD